MSDTTTEYGPCGECGESPLTIWYENQRLGESGPFTLTCPNGHDLQVPAEATARSRINALRAVVRDHKAARIDGYIVDAQTANLLVQVYNALSPASREKFGKPPLSRLVDLAWKHAA